MAVPSLVLGAFNLTDWSGSAYSTQVIAEGTSRGAPVPIEVAVQSWLQDGSIVVTQGYDNRTVTLRVMFRGPSLTAVSTAENAFFAELGKPNLLTWTPASGPAAVFVVVTSSMEEAPGEAGDLAEAQPFPWRYYNVRLICEAFTRSTTPFTSVGTAPGGAGLANLDTCAATTGWSATVDGVAGTVTNAAGPPTTVAVSASLGTGIHLLKLQKTFAATTSTNNLLVVDWLPSPAVGASLSAVGDGVTLPKYAEAASPTSGYTRSWFTVAAPSLAVTSFTLTSKNSSQGTPVRTLRLDNVAVTSIAPVVGTNRQQLRSLVVPGSARTPGSLAVESSTAALGNTLVYVYPADDSTTGYTPSLRQFRSAGNTVTANAAQISGSTEPVNGGSGVTFQVPIGLFPKGSYQLMAYVSTVGATLTFAGQTKIGSTVVGSFTTSASAAVPGSGGGWQMVSLGRIQLPTVDLDPASATAGVVMSLNVTASTACLYDEMWLFNDTIGSLIRVDCGTGAGSAGGSARRLFIDPASVSTPRPTVRIGHSADRSDSFYPATFPSWQFPQFVPPQVNALVVTPNATDAVVSLSGYARWHTNPAS